MIVHLNTGMQIYTAIRGIAYFKRLSKVNCILLRTKLFLFKWAKLKEILVGFYARKKR